MKESMVKYFVLIKTYIKYYHKYPMSIFLKLIYMPIQLLMYMFLWIAISKYSEIDLKYLICYYLFVILLTNAFPFAHIASYIHNDIFEGRIFNFLVRPVSYIVPYAARYISWMLCYSIVFFPSVLFVIIYAKIKLLNVLLFCVSLLIGLMIEFLIWINAGFTSMRIEKVKGVIMVTMVLKSLSSGNLIPFQLLPDNVRRIVECLPFKYYISEPINVLLQGKEPDLFFEYIVSAVIWIIALCLMAALQWNCNIKHLQMNIS